jgi:hypothetical protein
MAVNPSDCLFATGIFRPKHLRRKVGIWTVITVPTVITLYSTVQITVSQNYGVRTYKTVPPYGMTLTVIWLFCSNFDPEHFIILQRLSMHKTNYQAGIKYRVRLLSFHASHCWALPLS